MYSVEQQPSKLSNLGPRFWALFQIGIILRGTVSALHILRNIWLYCYTVIRLRQVTLRRKFPCYW